MKRSNMESLNCSKGNTVGIVVAYFLIYVVWGSTYFFIGVALKDFSPFLLGALRFTAAGIILLGICYLRGEQIIKKSLVKRSAVRWHCIVVCRYGCRYVGATLSDQ